jgi:hypothetical protein
VKHFSTSKAGLKLAQVFHVEHLIKSPERNFILFSLQIIVIMLDAQLKSGKQLTIIEGRPLIGDGTNV